MFRAGDRIGPYFLISKLGKGSFGVVWLAERRSSIITTQFALKLPKDEDIDLEAIKQEAIIWKQATGHPNIIPIIEADIYDSQVVIVSEYAPDGSLKEWLEKHGDKSPSNEASLDVMVGILCGLKHLHQRRIIHRDLKPDNILLQGETPRLADFGMAHVLKSSSQSAFIKGTPTYMAPEALEGKRSEQTDVWSAGVIFYKLVAGYLPFQQNDIPSLMWAITNRDPVPLPASVPSQLRNIILRSLEKSTDKRYKSVIELLAALRKADLSTQASNKDIPIITPNDANTFDESTIIVPKKKGVSLLRIPSIPLAEVTSQNKETIKVASDEGIIKEFREKDSTDEVSELFKALEPDASGHNPSRGFETHYSLGLAYKDMDLFDEAIGEFQRAFKMVGPEDPMGDYIQCCNMLGVCYLRKQMTEVAIMWFQRGLKAPGRPEDEYQALRYEIGLCYESLHEFDKALDVFMEVYGIDVSYRNVFQKIRQLQDAKAM